MNMRKITQMAADVGGCVIFALSILAVLSQPPGVGVGGVHPAYKAALECDSPPEVLLVYLGPYNLRKQAQL